MRLLMLCALAGAVAGLAGVVLDTGLYYATMWLFKSHLQSIQAGQLSDLFKLIAIPAAGLFLAGWLAWKWAPEICGGGVDAVIRAFHKGKGQVRGRVTFLKAFCTISTIGAGGSAGREGPIAQIGAAVGSSLGRWLHLSVRDRRLLMLAGCAGGLGAVLRAPLGAALFTAEMLYREPDFEHDAVIPGIISSVTAYSVFTAFLGYDPLLRFSIQGVPVAPRFPSEAGTSLELVHYALLSLLCAIVAYLFIQGLRLLKRHVFAWLPVPTPMKALTGGLILGGLAAVLCVTLQVEPGYVMGDGKEYLQEVIGNVVEPSSSSLTSVTFSLRMLVLVILFKIVATGLTVGSGASGGLLFPTLFIGAMTGAFYARLWLYAPTWLLPTAEARAGMIVVAMGGVFAGCTKTPIASLVLVSEMTGSYALAVPLMLCCASTYLLTTSFTLEEEQVPGMSDSPAHRGDYLVNVLEDIKVREAIRNAPPPDTVPADLPFNGVLERIKHSSATTFPIVDEKGCLIGVFSLSDIRQIMNDQTVGHLVVAGDLGTANVVTVTPETSLSEALTLFTRKNVNVLPVVEEPSGAGAQHGASRRIVQPRGPVGSKRVIGMLSRQDLIAAYRQRLLDIQRTEAQESQGAQGGSVFETAQESLALPNPEPLTPVNMPVVDPELEEPLQTQGNLEELDEKELLVEPAEKTRAFEIEDFPVDPYGPKEEKDGEGGT